MLARPAAAEAGARAHLRFPLSTPNGNGPEAYASGPADLGGYRESNPD